MSLKRPLERGDIVCVDFAPVVGKEMDYSRPAIVISPASFNSVSDLIIVCPITSNVRGSPWEVKLPKEMKTEGVIRIDHIKSIDKQRCEMHHHRVSVKEKTPQAVVDDVIAKLETLTN